MKRLALSVLGGVVIPFLYTIIVGPLTTYSDNRTLNLYAGYPVRWPVLILYRFFPLGFLENDAMLFLIFIGGNVLLYTLVTFVVLSAFWKSKATSREPPPPVQP